jgi:hypothetical protein
MEEKSNTDKITSDWLKAASFRSDHIADKQSFRDGFDAAQVLLGLALAKSPHLRYVQIAAQKYGVTMDEILGKGQHQPIPEARQYSVYLVEKHLKLPRYQIANLFNIHICTVRQSVDTTQIRIDTNQLRYRKS